MGTCRESQTKNRLREDVAPTGVWTCRKILKTLHPRVWGRVRKEILGTTRKIDTRIWNDAKFHSLLDDSKLIFIFILTHPNMTKLGAMRGTIAGLASELGWFTERLSKAFRELSEKRFLLFAENERCIAAKNFLKYNKPESPNVVKSWIHIADQIPECDLKTQVLANAFEIVKTMHTSFSKALPKAFRKAYLKAYPKAFERLSEYTQEDSPKALPAPDLNPSEESQKSSEKFLKPEKQFLKKENKNKEKKVTKEKKQEIKKEIEGNGLTLLKGEKEVNEVIVLSLDMKLDGDDLINPIEDFGTSVLNFVELWNSLPKPISKIQKMTQARKDKFKARMKERWWRENWRDAISKIPDRPFLIGKNKSGWVADVAFFLRPDSVAKIIEGGYKNGYAKQKPKWQMTVEERFGVK